MLVSILGRATGDIMGTVGVLLLLGWLGSAAAGADTYTFFITHASAWYGQVVLIGLTWVLLQHAATGLRHLVLDTGAGYELKSNRLWAIIVVAVPLLLTAALWLYIYFGKI